MGMKRGTGCGGGCNSNIPARPTGSQSSTASQQGPPATPRRGIPQPKSRIAGHSVGAGPSRLPRAPPKAGAGACGSPVCGRTSASAATSTASTKAPAYQKKKAPPSSGYGPKRDVDSGPPVQRTMGGRIMGPQPGQSGQRTLGGRPMGDPEQSTQRTFGGRPMAESTPGPQRTFGGRPMAEPAPSAHSGASSQRTSGGRPMAEPAPSSPQRSIGGRPSAEPAPSAQRRESTGTGARPMSGKSSVSSGYGPKRDMGTGPPVQRTMGGRPMGAPSAPSGQRTFGGRPMGGDPEPSPQRTLGGRPMGGEADSSSPQRSIGGRSSMGGETGSTGRGTSGGRPGGQQGKGLQKPGFSKMLMESTKKPTPDRSVTQQLTKLSPADTASSKTFEEEVSRAADQGIQARIDSNPDLDKTSPYAGALLDNAAAMSALPPKSPLGPINARSDLSTQVEQELEHAARQTPDKVVVVTGARTTRTSPPVVMTESGPVTPIRQIISEKTVEKSPGVERITRSMIGYEVEGDKAIMTELEMQRLEQSSPPPHPATPSRETVSVKSIISITPDGQRESTTFVTFDTTKPSENYGLTPEDVKRMVVEENQDVRKSLKWKPLEMLASTHTSFAVKKKEHEYALNEETLAELQKSVIIPDASPDEAPQDELQPELMATIMHTEEKGMDMLAEPTTVYTYLFPDSEDLGPDVIEINSAAPAPLHDVAVPSHSLPEAFYNNSLNAELEKIIMESSEGNGEKPSASGFSEFQEKKATEGKGGSPEAGAAATANIVANIKKRQRKARKNEPPTAIQDEKPPWEDSFGGGHGKSMVDLVGATPVHGTPSEIPADSFAIGLQTADAQDYVLYVEPPIFRSKVQLRGSTMPPWFPGYLVAFPEIPEIISVVKYPTIALTAAWKSTQPKVFPDDSFVVV